VKLVAEEIEPHSSTYRDGLAAGAALRLAVEASASASAGAGNAAAAPPMPTITEDVSRHAIEPIDNVWAAHTQNGLSTDLGKLSAEAKFTHFDVECRSKTCAGTVEWASMKDAMKGRAFLLHNEYSINTAVRVGQPDGEGDGPVRAMVFYEPVARA
jgi:hypothetical protein